MIDSCNLCITTSLAHSKLLPVLSSNHAIFFLSRRVKLLIHLQCLAFARSKTSLHSFPFRENLKIWLSVNIRIKQTNANWQTKYLIISSEKVKKIFSHKPTAGEHSQRSIFSRSSFMRDSISHCIMLQHKKWAEESLAEISFFSHFPSFHSRAQENV